MYDGYYRSLDGLLLLAAFTFGLMALTLWVQRGDYPNRRLPEPMRGTMQVCYGLWLACVVLFWWVQLA